MILLFQECISFNTFFCVYVHTFIFYGDHVVVLFSLNTSLVTPSFYIFIYTVVVTNSDVCDFPPRWVSLQFNSIPTQTTCYRTRFHRLEAQSNKTVPTSDANCKPNLLSELLTNWLYIQISVLISVRTRKTLYLSHFDEKKMFSALSTCSGLSTLARTGMSHNSPLKEKMLHGSVFISSGKN